MFNEFEDSFADECGKLTNYYWQNVVPLGLNDIVKTRYTEIEMPREEFLVE